MMNENALNAFIGTLGEISEKLEVLKEYVDNHMDTSPLDVGFDHVEKAEHILMKLEEVASFAGIE